jgi:hypothetical protein
MNLGTVSLQTNANSKCGQFSVINKCQFYTERYFILMCDLLENSKNYLPSTG